MDISLKLHLFFTLSVAPNNWSVFFLYFNKTDEYIAIDYFEKVAILITATSLNFKQI